MHRASRKPNRVVLSALPWCVLLLWAGRAYGQSLSVSFDGGGALATGSVQIIALVTVLSVVPGLAIMITSFPFLVTVLSILRQAIGLQQSPPNMLIVSLAMFLTFFIMEPVFKASWENGIRPFTNGEIEVSMAFEKSVDPFRSFMAARTDPETFTDLAALRARGARPETLSPRASLFVLVPSFLLSEIKRAFQIGFLVFLPFLIIDLVVAAVLMSMGMMMVPPAMVSLPFKLAFFVVADGWTLISDALVRGYF